MSKAYIDFYEDNDFIVTSKRSKSHYKGRQKGSRTESDGERSTSGDGVGLQESDHPLITQFMIRYNTLVPSDGHRYASGHCGPQQVTVGPFLKHQFVIGMEVTVLTDRSISAWAYRILQRPTDRRSHSHDRSWSRTRPVCGHSIRSWSSYRCPKSRRPIVVLEGRNIIMSGMSM